MFFIYIVLILFSLGFNIQLVAEILNTDFHKLKTTKWKKKCNKTDQIEKTILGKKRWNVLPFLYFYEIWKRSYEMTYTHTHTHPDSITVLSNRSVHWIVQFTFVFQGSSLWPNCSRFSIEGIFIFLKFYLIFIPFNDLNVHKLRENTLSILYLSHSCD